MVDKPVLYCMWRHLHPEGRMVDYLIWLDAAWRRYNNAWENWALSDLREEMCGAMSPADLLLDRREFERQTVTAFIKSGGTQLPC